jgi:predicted PurR-regulated permease PerM
MTPTITAFARSPDRGQVLIATLGGLAVFGHNDFVIGPVIAAMFIATWDIFSETRQEQRQEAAHKRAKTPAAR